MCPEADRDRVVEAADTLIMAADPDCFGDRAADRGAGHGAVDPHRVRHRAGQAPRAAPRRRPHDRARPGRGRRRSAHAPGDRRLPRAAVGRGQRHHPPHHLARDARADAQPRPAPGCWPRTSTPGCPMPSRSSCAGPRRCSPSAARPRATSSSTASRSRRGRRWSSSTTRATATSGVFDRPWELDITRSPNRHLGFGGGGPHYCLGASLARVQLHAIFGEMMRVIPDIEAGEPELLRSGFIHGIKRMPCTFTRARLSARSREFNTRRSASRIRCGAPAGYLEPHRHDCEPSPPHRIGPRRDDVRRRRAARRARRTRRRRARPPTCCATPAPSPAPRRCMAGTPSPFPGGASPPACPRWSAMATARFPGGAGSCSPEARGVPPASVQTVLLARPDGGRLRGRERLRALRRAGRHDHEPGQRLGDVPLGARPRARPAHTRAGGRPRALSGHRAARPCRSPGRLPRGASARPRDADAGDVADQLRRAQRAAGRL